MTMMNRECDVCDKPIGEWMERHEYHGADCPNSKPYGHGLCECDFVAHSQCCPQCNPGQKPTMIPITRITEPGSNHQLTLSDLIAMLDTLRHEQGNLPCYIYSTDRKAGVPLLSLCITTDAQHRVHFAAQTGSVCEEMYEDLREENERLRQAQRSQP